MISVVNVQQMLQLEAEAESHLEEHALMRTAAFGLYIEILNILRTHFGSAQRRSIVGLIGPGNNGSDALWAMSLLSRCGLKVSAIDTTQKREQGFVDQLYTSSNGMWQSFEDMPDSIDLIIDGIAGLRNNLAPSDAVLDFVTAHPESLVVAVDMPSCFDNDSATLIDADRVIVADYTVTFGYLKPCHVFNPARSLCGDVILVELPLAQVPEPVGQLMEPSDVSELLTELDIQSNKYTHG
ncbi:MAG: hypothetical protein RIS09_34, partial [Actinomycetota bacterium]